MKASLALLLLLPLAGCDSSEPPLFESRSARQTGIRFANTLQEDDSVYNPLAFDYLYNGAGVGVGDLDGDGRPDLYFGGNMVSSRLYLNRGELRFEDVTDASGAGTEVWATGVSMVDIDQNGLLDIYVSVAGRGSEAERANLLFINQGVGEDGVPRFREEAAARGIADTGYTTHAAFFDYDRDGDLDLYLLTNALEEFNRNAIRPRLLDGQAASTDRLYRNDGGRFTNVSREAGITIEGYGLGVAVSDLNQDGWPDLYVSNDFLTNDLVWVNNGDGTFTNRAARYLKHQAHNGMGADIADYNNDGRPDIVTVDMLPPDNRRQKLMVGRSTNDPFHMSLQMGYEPQYVRNTLQVNAGTGPDGEPRFSEIGQLAGVHATDWSWAPLFADFDNDGHKDLFISNGYRRDVTNLDFIVYSEQSGSSGSTDPAVRRRELYEEMKKLPEVRLHNYLFRNRGDLTFEDRSEAWGMTGTDFANGAAYADLDGDGDLDLVVNNLDGEASLYENRSERLGARHHLRVALRGPAGNRSGYGARVTLIHSGGRQHLEHYPYRGYKSTVEDALHFGLGGATRVDTLEVLWPDGRVQRYADVPADRIVRLDHADARPTTPAGPPRVATPLSEPTDHGLRVVHREMGFPDFKLTPTLPRKHSQDGPGIAVGDVDGNGLDDVFVGSDWYQPRALHLQLAPGRFTARPLPVDSAAEDMGALFFDADGDGDQDLYLVSGGNFPSISDSFDQDRLGASFFQDRLLVNDGRGNFRRDPAALPEENVSGSSVVAADFDRDGDLDLFVGGRLVPGKYPTAPASMLLRNDSRPGRPRFTDVTDALAPGLRRVGMVTSALWTDVDADGHVDLLLAGEWMPLKLFRNTGDRLEDATAAAGLAGTSGWWNSLAAADFDGDGDTDYLAGNMGLNSRFRASPEEPVRVHARDFDGNGSIDPILSYYLDGKSYPVPPRDVLIDQIISMKGRFKRFVDYAGVTMDGVFGRDELEGAQVAEARTMASSILVNVGGGRLEARALPVAAQVAPIFGMIPGDRDGDGRPDALIAGNSYASDTHFGAYDASMGTLLRYDGRGGFAALDRARSGFFVEGDAKAAAEVMVDERRSLLLVSQNGDSLRVFSSAPGHRNVRVRPLDAYATITLADGRTVRHELYHGSSFLSQSSRFVPVPRGATRVTLHDFAGRSRPVPLN